MTSTIFKNLLLLIIVLLIAIFSSCSNDMINTNIILEQRIVSITPQEANIGDTVRITGQGFPTDALVVLSFDCIVENRDVTITDSEILFVTPECATSGIIGITGFFSRDQDIYFTVLEPDVTMIPSINNLTEIDFYNQNIGIASNEQGIFKTIDKGINWNLVFTSATHELFNISENEIWALLESGILVNSLDAGANWNEINIPGINEIIDSYITDQSAYIIGLRTSDAKAALLKSDNKGQSWVEISDADEIRELENYKIFFDSGLSLKLYHAYSRRVATTSNQEVWENIPLPILPEIDVDVPLFFLNENLGFTTTDDMEFLVTEDGGRSWRRRGFLFLDLSNEDDFITDLFFFNEEIGIMLSKNGAILRTRNGGWQWEIVHLENNILMSDFNNIDQTIKVLNQNSESSNSLISEIEF